MRLLMTADAVRRRPDEWARRRDELVGASDIGSLAGLDDAYGSPFGVYLNKISHADKPDALSMRIGRHFESLVLDLFAESNPELVVTPGGLYVSTVPGREWQAATFDALAYGETDRPIPVQAKTTYKFDPQVWGDPPDGEIPGPYLAQCLQEIDVADAEYAYLPVLPTGVRGAPRVYRIKRDDDELAMLREVGETFYQALIGQIPPPARDGHPATTRALKQMYAQAEVGSVVVSKRLGRRARVLYAAMKLAEQRYDAVANELREAMGFATRAITRDGDVIATRSLYSQHRIRVGEVRARHPRIAKRYGYDVPIDKLTVKQPKIGS